MAKINQSLQKLRNDWRVESVDDERSIGNALIVTMKPGWTTDPLDQHAGVFGADTVTEAWKSLRAARQYMSNH